MKSLVNGWMIFGLMVSSLMIDGSSSVDLWLTGGLIGGWVGPRLRMGSLMVVG